MNLEKILLFSFKFNKWLVAISVITVAVSVFTLVHFGVRQTENMFLKKELEQMSSHWTDVVLDESSVATGVASEVTSALPRSDILEAVNVAKGIIAYKIYDADGIIVASSQTGLIGSVNREPYFDRYLRTGRQYIDIEVQEEIGHRVVAGVYQPIIRENEFVGAFELHFDVTPMASHIREIGDYAILLAGIVLAGTSVAVFILFLYSNVERTRHAVMADTLRRAEAASNSKSMFLANMSHEFRSPLNAIIGFAEMMMLSEAIASNPAKVKEYANDINQSGGHLLSLINEMLEVAEVGKLKLQDDVESLETLLARTALTVSKSAEGKNVEIQMPTTGDVTLLNVDSEKFVRALVNVMSNAIKFTASGGAVNLDIARTSGSGLELTITDTGIGIPEDKIAVVLEPFEQASDTAYVHYDGLGLGIAISRQIIEAHGGTLAIASNVGIGTTVTITLPGDRVKDQPNFGTRAAKKPRTLQSSSAQYQTRFDMSGQAGQL